MRLVRSVLLGPLLIFGIFSGSVSQAKVPEFVKKMAKNYVCKQMREVFYKRVSVRVAGSFDMQRFDELGEEGQVAMVEAFITSNILTRYLKTDTFIAWNLGLYKSTVVRIRQKTEKEFEGQPAEIITYEIAKRLTTRVRRVNFFRNNWGKMLVGAGVGITAATVGFAYYLNSKLLNNTQIR